MKTVDETRRARLADLVREFGTAANLADTIGCSPAQLSQWLNASKESKTGKPRGMRKETARLIERKCGRPVGWLDGLGGQMAGVADSIVGDRWIPISDEEKELLAQFRQLQGKGARLRVLAAVADEIESEAAQAHRKKGQGPPDGIERRSKL